MLNRNPYVRRKVRSFLRGSPQQVAFSHIRQDFLLARVPQPRGMIVRLTDGLGSVANVRTHGTTQRIVAVSFAAERNSVP